jgi:hypothetical protein
VLVLFVPQLNTPALCKERMGMKISEMMDLTAWARLTKIIQHTRPKPHVARKVQAKATVPKKLTDFERNTNTLRTAVSALKPKQPIPPVYLRT